VVAWNRETRDRVNPRQLGKDVVDMVDVRLQSEIVVVTEDRVGLLAEVSRLLGDMGIGMVSVVVQRNGGSASLHLVTSCQSHAVTALRDAGFVVEERDVVLMEIPNHPGFLGRMSEALARKNIAIEELYTTVSDDSQNRVVIFRCSDNGNAVLWLRGR
jgi:hypothetical protein